MDLQNIMKKNRTRPVIALVFRKGTEVATVVTDGERTRSFRIVGNKDHESLTNAIGYLEARGYKLDPEEFI